MKALVIFSGGQDSTTCLGYALKKYEQVVAISFKYGQKHEIELTQARIICEKLNVELHEIDISFFGQMVDSALTHNGNVNEKHARLNDLPASFVPNRNALFITLSHAFAQKIGAEVLVTGTCETDFSGYNDCRLNFIKSIERSLNVGTFGHNLTSQWIAGFIEREGCISQGCYKLKDGTKKYFPSFSLEQTDKNILYELVAFFGCGSVVYRKKDHNSLGKKDSWEFKLQNYDCKYVFNIMKNFSGGGRQVERINVWETNFKKYLLKNNNGSYTKNNYKPLIVIDTPLMYLNKAETFKLAEDCNILDIVLKDSHTCYNGIRENHEWGAGCADCPSCKLREKGYNEYLIMKGKN